MESIFCFHPCTFAITCSRVLLFETRDSQGHRYLECKSVDLSLRKLGAVWYTYSNTCFQFLNNITCISTHFFIHMYFHTCFQFLSACTKYLLDIWFFFFFWFLGGAFLLDIIVDFLKFTIWPGHSLFFDKHSQSLTTFSCVALTKMIRLSTNGK